MQRVSVLILNILAGLALVAVSIFAYLDLQSSSTKTRAAAVESCTKPGKTLSVVIRNGSMQPRNITGHLCDTLTIINEDDITREIGFGDHDQHVAYDGVSEKVIGKGEGLTITLDKTGEYLYHDHFHDEVSGTFTVTD